MNFRFSKVAIMKHIHIFSTYHKITFIVCANFIIYTTNMNTDKKFKEPLDELISNEEHAPGYISKTSFFHTAAFIDLLGTSALFSDFEKNAVAIIKAYRSIRASLSKWPDTQEISNSGLFDKRCSVSIFSDSVVIFSPEDIDTHTKYEADAYLAYSIARAQYDLIVNHGVFIRGGICSGSCLYSSDGIFASEAFVSAYKLESQVANFPIIILPTEWVKSMIQHRISGGYEEVDGFIYGNNEHFMRVTLNGKEYAFIHYLHYELMNVAIHPVNQNDRMDILDAHKDAIITAYNKVKDSCSKAAEKYIWLAHQYHNHVVKSEGMPQKLLITEHDIPKSLFSPIRAF